MNAPVFFKSAGDERGTPQDFFDALNAEFHFDLDAAAGPLNHKCPLYFGEGGVADDALEADWGGDGSSVFLNPPYSVAGAFIAKAREEADKGALVVMLLPVRSDTKWWHKYIWDKDCPDQFQVERLIAEGKARGDDLTMIYGPGLPLVPNGDWRPFVRGRLLPGRLNFELVVPQNLRTWIKEQVAAGTGIESLKTETGLPKMAIDRICDDMPDDCLLEGAPFPSCVIIFSKAA